MRIHFLAGAIALSALCSSCDAPTRNFGDDAELVPSAFTDASSGYDAGEQSSDTPVVDPFVPPGSPEPGSEPGVTPFPMATGTTPGVTATDSPSADGDVLDAGSLGGGAPPMFTDGNGGTSSLGGSGGSGGLGVGGQGSGGLGVGGQSSGVPEAGAGGQSSCPESGGVCGPSCSGCLIDEECIADGVENPENECELCDPSTNAEGWSNKDGEPCDDGEYCTVNDACNLESCVGEVRDCDDGVSCNGTEACDEDLDECVAGQGTCGADLCDLQLDACVSVCDGCLIAGQCVPDGQEAPGNPCMVCDVTASDDSYTGATGKACGQGSATCSAQDTCNAQGVCQPNHSVSGAPCGSSTSNTCNGADACDGAGSCATNVATNGTTCDDGLYCTTSSECQGGSCVGTVSRSCGANQQCNEQTDGCVCTGCQIGASCVATGVINPSNTCQVCVPSVSAVNYSPNTGANCGSAAATCSLQDTCNSSGSCQANHSPAGTPCTGGECSGGVCEPFTNPFDCVAPDPPTVALPGDEIYGMPGNPPSNTGGTIVNGVYTPVRIDLYDGGTTFDLLTFEFSNGFVQLGFQNINVTNGFAPIDEIQFMGSFSTSGSTLTWDLERCDPQYNLDPDNVLYTVSANGLRIQQSTFNGERVVVTYQRN